MPTAPAKPIATHDDDDGILDGKGPRKYSVYNKPEKKDLRRMSPPPGSPPVLKNYQPPKRGDEYSVGTTAPTSNKWNLDANTRSWTGLPERSTTSTGRKKKGSHKKTKK